MSSPPDDVHAAADAPAGLSELVTSASREFVIVVDERGTIRWADPRAVALALGVGERLTDHVVPGCESKADELCRQASLDLVTRWELPLVVAGTPVTCLFSARPHDGGAALLGSLIQQDFAEAIATSNRAVHEIVELNRELARQKQRLLESNVAVRALHAELEQHADRLRAASEIKSRLVSAVSHEFRTPLHSILGLGRLLLDQIDGPLADEQLKQVRFILDSADELSRMINDMLELSRIDAGTAPIRSEVFELRDFLAALAGTMAPLIPDGSPVRLVFDPAPDLAIETDRGKLAQIVRNLVANAIKFTERGEIRVRTIVFDDSIRFTVSDTGIGIAPADQARVFEEFVQIESPLQRKSRGTGLGLPLAKKLAETLGGKIELDSEPGVGTTFTVSVPQEHTDIARYRDVELAARTLDPTRAPVLIVEDDRRTIVEYDRNLSVAGFQVVPARSTEEARRALARFRPTAVLLDVMLEGEDTWNLLTELKTTPETAEIPVLVCTVTNRESRARALGADEFWQKPLAEEKLIAKLTTIARGRGARVLVIDDDPAARYLIAKYLQDTPYELLEAATGRTGVELAQAELPDVILLDFLLGHATTAFEVMEQLDANPKTRQIPIIIVTSQVLAIEERERLSSAADAIVPKDRLSREQVIAQIRQAVIRATPGRPPA